MPIKLNEELSKEKDGIEKQLDKVNRELYTDSYRKNILELGKRVHEFHLALIRFGVEPVHYKYMIKNRGCDSDHPDFYNHVHPIEDLLQFLKDPDSIKDDVTMGDKFKFKFFLHMYGQTKSSLTRVPSGWIIQHFGTCNEILEPFISQKFKRHNVEYPVSLGKRFGYIWKQASEGLSHNAVQEAINDICKWVNMVEKTAPRHGVWKKFNR